MGKYFESTSEALLTSPGVFSSIAQDPAILNCRQVSPYYINCASVWGNPDTGAKNIIANNMTNLIRETTGGEKIDKITTTAVKGMCIGVEVSTEARLDLPFVFVRPTGKGYGKQENKINPGDYVVAADDLVTEAGTAVMCIDTTIKQGGKIDKYFVIFDRKQDGGEKIMSMGVMPSSLAWMDPKFIDMIEKFRLGKDVSRDDLKIFRLYSESPVDWSRNYLIKHPEYVREKIEKSISETGVIEPNAPVLEIFTKESGHPELKGEFNEMICKWLEEFRVKNDVLEFGYTGFIE